MIAHTQNAPLLPESPVTPMKAEELNFMIEAAMAHPQLSAAPLRTPVISFARMAALKQSYNARMAAFASGGMALAASMLLAVSLLNNPSVPTNAANPFTSPDPLTEMTDMMTYDIIS